MEGAYKSTQVASAYTAHRLVAVTKAEIAVGMGQHMFPLAVNGQTVPHWPVTALPRFQFKTPWCRFKPTAGGMGKCILSRHHAEFAFVSDR